MSVSYTPYSSGLWLAWHGGDGNSFESVVLVVVLSGHRTALAAETYRELIGFDLTAMGDVLPARSRTRGSNFFGVQN